MLGVNWSNKHVRFTSLAILASVAIYLAVRITNFVHIFQTHAGILLTQVEVLDDYNTGTVDPEEAVVPRIIHQIFHNWTHPEEEVLPKDWAQARQSCIDFNSDWENILWTPKTSRDFIETNYPWFLSTYEGFTFPVQKIDTLRYFLMRHYGGIYIDLDNGCTASLEPLRYYPVWVTDGGRGTLSNNILGAAPEQPFWIMLTDSIQYYAWKYPLPYITISYATGQWFETAMWDKYHSNLDADGKPLTRILMDGRTGAPEWKFFNHNRGGTWDNWDNQWFAWVGIHIIQIVAFAVAVPVIAIIVYIVAKRRRRRRYTRVKAEDEDIDLDEGDRFRQH